MSPDARFEGALIHVVGRLVLLFLVAPMLVVGLASLDPGQFFTFPPQSISVLWYAEFLRDSSWRAALILTLTIAAFTGLLATVIGGLAGIAVARIAPRFRRFLYALLVAPLAVPVIVLAISFYGVVLRLHLVGSLGTFVAANTLLTVPLVALFVAGAALGADPRLEFASLSLGASRWRTLWRITVPVIAPTAIAGGILAFLNALDEVVMSVFLVAPGRTPLAVKMFLQVQTSTPPVVMAASSLLILSSVVVVGSLTVLRGVVGSLWHPGR
jgi:ABC-type spermidine/putrescine transport system permease subunit II